jgi:replicative DNA helicase
LVGGDLAMLLMRTGNGKTTVSLGMARDAARRINSGEIEKENAVIVFVTLEQQAEHVDCGLSANLVGTPISRRLKSTLKRLSPG